MFIAGFYQCSDICSYILIHGDLVALAKTMPQTRLVDVCDREVDFFEFFDEQRNHPGVDILIRAKHDRKLKVIGGFLGRKNDPPPGYQLLWQGYTAMQYRSIGYSLVTDDL